MYTINWRENSQDRWDRLETKEEVMELLVELATHENVEIGDIWIFSPKADDFAKAGDEWIADFNPEGSK